MIPKPHEFISFASSSFGLNELTCAFLSFLCISAIYLNFVCFNDNLYIHFFSNIYILKNNLTLILILVLKIPNLVDDADELVHYHVNILMDVLLVDLYKLILVHPDMHDLDVHDHDDHDDHDVHDDHL